METSAVIFLLISCAVSFGLGRGFVHFRDKKRDRQAQELAAKSLRDQPAEAQSLNKSKRKRQLQRLAKKGEQRPR